MKFLIVCFCVNVKCWSCADNAHCILVLFCIYFLNCSLLLIIFGILSTYKWKLSQQFEVLFCVALNCKTTCLENLECSGNSQNLENLGNYEGTLYNHRRNKILWPDVGKNVVKYISVGAPPRTLLITIVAITFCCDDIWKSKLMVLEKPGKLGVNFFPTFVIC